MKVLTGVGAPLAGRLLTYQSLHNRFYDAQVNTCGKLDRPCWC